MRPLAFPELPCCRLWVGGCLLGVGFCLVPRILVGGGGPLVEAAAAAAAESCRSIMSSWRVDVRVRFGSVVLLLLGVLLQCAASARPAHLEGLTVGSQVVAPHHTENCVY